MAPTTSLATTVLATLEKALFRGLLRLPRPVKRLVAGSPVVLDGQTLDLDTAFILRLQQLLREPPVESLPVEQMRAAMLRQSGLVGGRQPIGSTRDLVVPCGGGEIAARLYVPRVAEHEHGPLLFFIHGGGMVYGDLDSHDQTCRFLAERAGVRVLAIDYRLAPEHPYPAAVEDCWAAYRWVSENAAGLGADPERIAVGGDSAGGYLSAVTAIKAAEAGVPCAFQLLIYPVTDMAGQTESRRLFGQGFFLTDEFMAYSSAAYLPEGDLRDPSVSVGYTHALPAGLAPAYVATAGFDPLRDEGEAYARKLADAGVPVQLKRYPGFVHGFTNMVGVPGPRAGIAEIAVKLKAALRDPDVSRGRTSRPYQPRRG